MTQEQGDTTSKNSNSKPFSWKFEKF